MPARKSRRRARARAPRDRFNWKQRLGDFWSIFLLSLGIYYPSTGRYYLNVYSINTCLTTIQLYLITRDKPISLVKGILEVLVLGIFTILMHPLFLLPVTSASRYLALTYRVILGRVIGTSFGARRDRIRICQNSSDDKDRNLEDEEPTSEYTYGGYCPVRIHQKFNNGRYKILRKLGWGMTSTVWLALDTYHGHKRTKLRNKSTDKYVALKIVKASTSKKSQEVEILRKIRYSKSHLQDHPGTQHLPTLLEDFTHKSAFGLHKVLVLEVLGPNVMTLKTILFGHWSNCASGIMTRVFARDILRALEFLHEVCGVIHKDIKFDNILYRLRNADEVVDSYLEDSLLPCGVSYTHYDHIISESLLTPGHLFQIQPIHVLSDFSAATWEHKHANNVIQPLLLRAPEVMFNVHWDEKVDIWNFGLILHEFAGFGRLFDGVTTNVEMPETTKPSNKKKKKKEIVEKSSDARTVTLSSPDELLIVDQIIALVGGVPKRYYTNFQWDMRVYFDENGRLHNKYRRVLPTSWDSLSKNIEFRTESEDNDEEEEGNMTAMEKWQIEGFYEELLEFVRNAVAYKHNRWSAKKLLAHEWFKGLDEHIQRLPTLEYFDFSIIKLHRYSKVFEEALMSFNGEEQ